MALTSTSSPTRPSVQTRTVSPTDQHVDDKIAVSDLVKLALLTVFGTAAWLLPKSVWPWVAEKMARLRSLSRSGLNEAEMAVMRTVIGKGRSDHDCMMHYRACLTYKYQSWLHLLRCHRPGAADPTGDLVGEQHLHDALASGKGAILWVGGFAFNDLFTKATLYQNGFDLYHLSRPSHGFSASWFGRTFLNPLLTRIECRYLRERIVIGGEKGNRLTDLEDCLAAGGVVSITVCGLGKRLFASNFLDGEIQIAVGALKLAHQTGASVLPVFTTSDDDGRIVTVIEEPLPMRQDIGRQEAIEEALAAYIPLLEAKVRRSPAQFNYSINVAHESLFVLPAK